MYNYRGFPRKLMINIGVVDLNNMENIKNEMLSKKVWAVVGVTPNKEKFGYKIYKKLKQSGYTVYPINPKYDEVEGDEIYSRVQDLPEKPQCINIVVNPRVANRTLEDIKEQSIDYVWFQPGTFDDDVIKKAQEYHMEIVYHDCVLVALRKG